MKKIMTVLLVLLISDCNAATGNASDGPLFAVVVIGLMLLIVGTGYFIDFMKNQLKEFRRKRLLKRNNFDQDSEFLNSFNKAIPEIDGISNF
jgi:hypothetical protein